MPNIVEIDHTPFLNHRKENIVIDMGATMPLPTQMIEVKSNDQCMQTDNSKHELSFGNLRSRLLSTEFTNSRNKDILWFIN